MSVAKSESLSIQLNRRVLLLSVIAVVAVVIVMVLALVLTLHNVRWRIQSDARSAVSALDLFLLDIESDVQATSATINASNDVRSTLLQMRVRHPELLDVILLDVDGKVIAQRNAMGREPIVQITDVPWESALRNNLNAVYVSPVLFQDETPYVEMASSVTDEIGLPTGTLLVRIELTDLWSSTISIHVGETGYVYIADSTGQIVAYRNRSLITEGNLLEQLTGHMPNELAEASLTYYTGLNGESVVGLAYPMESANWYVIAEQPVVEAFQNFFMGMALLVIMLIAVMILLVNVNIFARKRIIRPLQILGESVKQIESGNLDIQVKLGQNDELGHLGDLFNTMTVHLKDLLNDLQNQASRVQQIIDTVPEGVILLNQAYEIVSANPVGQKDLITLSSAHIDDRLTHLGDRNLDDLLISPPRGLWHEIKPTDNTERVFEMIARPIEAGPISGGWVLILHDVTHERNQQERLQTQSRLASVGQLAAGIAHDFNNILAIIILRAQMLQRTQKLSTQGEGLIETILNQSQRASDLIGQILDFSRQSVMERRPLSLKTFLKEQVKLLEHALPENIQMQITLDDGEFMIIADPTRIQQVAMNLVINARDAMPDGGELGLKLSQTILSDDIAYSLDLAPGHYVEWTIQDTGTGIDDTVLSKVFEPFVTTKAPGKGTGLGLAQVYGIVKQHAGSIDVDTSVGQGTTFTIYLPVLDKPEEEQFNDDGSDVPEGNGETILVVEDDAEMQLAIKEILDVLGYEVILAENGQEGLNTWLGNQSRIDLVLSDIVMPEMGGIALFHALNQQSSSIKVILMTGHTGHVLDSQFDLELDDLKLKGLCGWFQKPPRLEQIAQVVHSSLQG